VLSWQHDSGGFSFVHPILQPPPNVVGGVVVAEVHCAHTWYAGFAQYDSDLTHLHVPWMHCPMSHPSQHPNTPAGHWLLHAWEHWSWLVQLPACVVGGAVVPPPLHFVPT
jgi:hypothetical protein